MNYLGIALRWPRLKIMPMERIHFLSTTQTKHKEVVVALYCIELLNLEYFVLFWITTMVWGS